MKMKMKSICIITSKYPSIYNKSSLVFVQQLVWTLADLGIKSTVICPIAVNIDIIPGIKLPFKRVEITSNGSEVDIYHPRYIGFGQQNLKVFNTASLTLESFANAVDRVIRKIQLKPDVIYGHFISPAGVTAARLGEKYSIPSYIAYGESSPWSINNLGINKVINELKDINGVVSVSTKNKNELLKLGIVDSNKVEVFPNAIRADKFYQRDKIEARNKFNIRQDLFVVAFVGHFIERKGIDKVVKMIDSLEGVYGIFAGKGPINPVGEKTLYCNTVDPDELPWFYSAADVFVLPTQNEGCCNAIIEAMSCGLPIISSDREFNYDILDKETAILVNPDNQDEIISAVKILYDNKEYRKKLSLSSLKNARTLNYEERGKNIINWIEKML